MSNPLLILRNGLPLNPLPPPQSRDNSVPHKNRINISLLIEEKKLAVKNALRYFPSNLHEVNYFYMILLIYIILLLLIYY